MDNELDINTLCAIRREIDVLWSVCIEEHEPGDLLYGFDYIRGMLDKHIKEINGMKNRDYREKKVFGMICNVKEFTPKIRETIVRMTSDDKGQSLSLQCEDTMIEIPLESVSDIIKVSEKGDKK